MISRFQPQLVLVSMLAGWLNREQQRVLEYLQEENRVLKRKLGKKRLRLTDDERRRLAAKAKLLGRKLLFEFATIVTPDTLLRWHRELIARKWTFEQKRVGRPGLMKEIARLIVKMAKENPTWGYRRIQGALSELGHRVAHNTVKKVLKANGIEPAPERSKRTSWNQFLRAHWSTLGASDFFTVEVWTLGGLVTFYVFFVVQLKTRKVKIAGSTPSPNARFMRQVAIELTAYEDSFLTGTTHLIRDGDKKFTREFESILLAAGIKSVKIPPRCPDCNSIAERFVRSAKSEAVNRLILIGERSLRRVLREYEIHFNRERHHQGLGNRLIDPERSSRHDGAVEKRERLGGLLSFYFRSAA